MKPSDRTSFRSRRRIPVALAGLLAFSGATADDFACRAPIAEDPRLEELRQADPDDPRIDITSDRGELGRTGDASLEGNVRIRRGQRLLTADAAEIDAERRSVSLKGIVEYLDPSMHVRGQGGTFEDRDGTFEGAEFELLDRSVRGSATSMQLREGRFLDLEGVRYTACPPGSDDWKLDAREISIDNETMVGTGRDVKVEFLGVPILYTPWISFPVGDERKSGLLFPTIGSSGKTGTQIAIPWYWNIAPNYDATFTPRYFSSRGLRLDAEFRYLTARSRGTLDTEYLYNDLQTGEQRGLVELRHVTHLQPLTRVRIDAADASDANYFEDFGLGFEGTSVTFLDRLGEFRHDTTNWSLIGQVQDYQVLDRGLPEDERPYATLPRVNALGRWRDVGYGLDAEFRAEAVNFERGVGITGQRLDVEPSLAWRAENHGAYVGAGASWRATAYSLAGTTNGADDSPLRSLPLVSAETGLMLERPAGSKGQRLQTLEPRVLYLFVPYRDQDELPVFDTGIPDLNLVQLFRTNRYVGPDRVSDANQVSVGITSRLLDAAGGRQFISGTIGQAFFFEDPRVRLPDEPVRDRSTSDIIAQLELTAFKDWNARAGYQWNPDETRTEKSELYLQYRPASDRVVNAGYRYTQDLLEQFDVSAAWPLGDRWRAFGRWVYSLQEEKTLDQFVGFEYGACCWALRVVTRRFVSSRTGATDTSIGLQLELKGLSSVGVDNESFLRDAIRGYSALPPEPRS